MSDVRAPDKQAKNVLFAVCNSASMGICPSQWHNASDASSGEGKLAPAALKFMEKYDLKCSNNNNSTRLDVACKVIRDVFYHLSCKATPKRPFNVTMVSFSDRIDSSSEGSFPKNPHNVMLNLRSLFLQKKVSGNCNVDVILNYLKRKRQDRVQFDRAFIIFPLDQINDQSRDISILTKLVPCSFVVLSERFLPGNGPAVRKSLIAAVKDTTSTIDICIDPTRQAKVAKRLYRPLTSRGKKAQLPGVRLAIGKITSAHVQVLSARSATKKNNKDDVLVRRLAIDNRSGISVIGFCAAFGMDRHLIGIGSDERYVIHTAFKKKSKDSQPKDKDYKYLKKKRRATKNVLFVLRQSLVQTGSAAFCRLRTRGLLRHGLIFVVRNGVQALPDKQGVRDDQCHLVLALLPTDASRSPETWKPLLQYHSQTAQADDGKRKRSPQQSVMGPSIGWTNVQLASKDIMLRINKQVQRGAVAELNTEVECLLDTSAVLGVDTRWLADALAACVSSAVKCSPPMKMAVAKWIGDLRQA